MLETKIATLRAVLEKKYGPGFKYSEHDLLVQILEDMAAQIRSSYAD